MFIACFDDPILTTLSLQTAVSTRQQAVYPFNFERSSSPFGTINLVIPNPQSGDFADNDDQIFVEFGHLVEEVMI